MPRCDCSGTCTCTIIAGAGIKVSGGGTPSSPIVIEAENPGGGSGSGVPSGVISAFGGTSPPAGWLFCNGAPVSRGSYSNLFAAIGTTWGAGDGASTFNLPDLSGRFLRAAGGPDAVTLGGVGGASTVTLLPANLPPHTHQMQHYHGMEHTHYIDHVHGIAGHNHAISAEVLGVGNHSHDFKIEYQENTEVKSSGGQKRVTDVANQTGAGGTSKTATTSAAGGHTHGINIGIGGVPDFASGTSSLPQSGESTRAGTNWATIANTGTGNEVGSQAFSILPPWRGVAYIIKT